MDIKMINKLYNKIFDKTPVSSFLEKEKTAFILTIPSIEEEKKCKILLAFVRGSHMYGTATKKSDVDITFVYQQPTDEILKGNYTEQTSVGGNDIVGYEIQRFIQLLGQNNPNILEALDIPEDCLIYKHESMDNILKQEIWLSKLTEKTILGYADSQIKKATGLKKKMNNPMVEKKDLIDFCYIVNGHQTKPLREFIVPHHNNVETCGLVKVPNGKGLYGLYVDWEGTENFRGILKDSESTQLRLSTVSKEFAENNKAHTMWYNQDGYEVWKKDYESYQKWLTERNETRYDDNMKAGKSYDTKNMMHLFRLLSMAWKISMGEGLQVREEEVEWLMEIRRGEIEYDELMENSEVMFELIKSNFDLLNLQESPDKEFGKELLLKFRKNGY